MLLIKHHHRGRCADYQTGCRRERETLFRFFILTCVENLLDDHGHLSLQHGVQQLDDEDEAGAEDEQRQGQENEAHRQVRQINIDKDVLACNGQRDDWHLSVHSALACIM